MQNDMHVEERYTALLEKHRSIQPNDLDSVASRLTIEIMGDREMRLWVLEQFAASKLKEMRLAALRQQAVLRGQIEATKGRVAQRHKLAAKYRHLIDDALNADKTARDRRKT